METLILVDASGLIYRSYFAIRNMTNDKGESTNALFGFVRSLLKLIADFKPHQLAAIFDGPNNAEKRKALYPAYKAHRAAMPPDLLYQIQWAKEFCKHYGISILDVPGVEADDTIASIACWQKMEGRQTLICSTDKDLCQIVDEKTELLDVYKENQIVGREAVLAKFGVPPEKIVDYLSLTGDSSDNVPGVPGIGPKTAAELINSFGSLDNLLQQIDQIPGKKKQELFEKHANDALLSRALVTLDKEVDFPKEESFFHLKKSDEGALKEFYKGVRFSSLLKEMEKGAPSEVNNKRYQLVDEEKSLKDLITHLEKHTDICVDTETTAIDPMRAELVGIGLGVSPEESWYIPCNGQMGMDVVKKLLKPLFSNPKLRFFGHNLKYDLHVLRRAGLRPAQIGFDTIIASYLLNTHSRRHSLDELTLENFNFVKTATSELIGKGKSEITMKEVPIERVSNYCCEDVDYTIRLKNLLQPQIAERGLSQLFYDLELPLIEILERMETAGIYLDAKILHHFGQELESKLHALKEEIYSLAQEPFNLNSPKQIAEILFEKMGIPAPKGTSTNAEVLELLKWEYPIAGKIQEYRGLEKLRSTYVETLPTQINPETGRIHCTFNQSVAATGRLSSQDPNLQNIPVRSAEGLKIREAFKPQKEGWSYFSADYSQIELRLLAHMSEDPALIDAFLVGEDVHRHTASVVFHVPIEEVTKEMRSRAKAVNFGVIYGQGAYGLSQSLGIPQKEAAQFIDTYFKKYPKVKGFLEGCKDRARLTGKAVTLTGRERAIPEINSKNAQIRNAAERLAVNTPFQGTAADLIKLAMLKIDREIMKNHLTGYMILQIHDELIFEVPDEEVPLFEKIVTKEMESVMELKVPLTVHTAVGKNWKEC